MKSDYIFSVNYVCYHKFATKFRNENLPWSPSSSQHGDLRLPTSQLLVCCFVLGITHPEVTVQSDVKIYDGFVVVQALPRGNLQHPLTLHNELHAMDQTQAV